MKPFLCLFLLLALPSFLLLPPPVCCVASTPNTKYVDAGNGVTDIFRKDSYDKNADSDDNDEDTTKFLGQIRGNQKFLIVRHGKYHADLVVFINGKRLYTMPDESFLDYDYGPGRTDEGYDFYLSPDHLSLFVVRPLASKLSVGYLYRRSGPGRMKIVRPGGVRLQDAAWRLYFARHKTPKNLELETHTVHFVQWDTAKHQVIFSCDTMSYQTTARYPDGISYEWYMAYNLKTGRLKILMHTDHLPAPQ